MHSVQLRLAFAYVEMNITYSKNAIYQSFK